MTKLAWCAALLCACGNSSPAARHGHMDGPAGTGSDAAPAVTDARVFLDAPADARVFMDAPADAAQVFLDAPPGTYPLTVKNYLDWCSVSVGGGAFSADAVQVVNVMPGTIPLVAQPASTMFELAPGMWHHTDGDAGTGDSGVVAGGQSSAVKTVGTAPACVWVCCPFTTGVGCAIPDQC